MSPYRWPIHFGLLNNDALWIFDEIQLMGAGLVTSVQLQAFRDKEETYGPTHTLWMSATLQKEWLKTVDNPREIPDESILSLSSEDQKNPRVHKLLSAQKLLLKADTLLTKANEKHYAHSLVTEVLKEHITGTTTLVVVNRVARAQEIYHVLKKQLGKESIVDCILIHSQFRPLERLKMEDKLKTTVSGINRIIVATQAIEAGVNISCKSLFTELSPWASLVQRFGRNNRFGETTGKIFWIDTELKPELVLPYTAEELDRARTCLRNLKSAAIDELPHVNEEIQLTYVLRHRDLLSLFDTTPDMTGANIDVSSYIRESDDSHLQVFWRNLKDGKPSSEEADPVRAELCNITLSQMKIYLKGKVDKKQRKVWMWDKAAEDWKALTEKEIRPGIVVMLDCAMGGYNADVGFSPKDATVVPLIDENEACLQPHKDDEESLSVNQGFKSITLHSEEIIAEAEKLGNAFSLVWPREEYLEAALRHDWGKAIEAFQETMTRQLREENPNDLRLKEFWAKSPYRNHHRRKYLRHELASALACLAVGKSDLIAYLVAAHHGKIRMAIKALPLEETSAMTRIAHGIVEGEKIPSVNLGKEKTKPLVLDLSVMDIGGQENNESWSIRMLKLLDKYGPFRLAWLESLLRIADWRASKRGMTFEEE